jgi:adenosine 3'-phospho 5'-phosphosulfate transporter B2
MSAADSAAAAASATTTTIIRGQQTIGDIFFTLSVNFLLYVTLIIVFYMLVRFYLEEETAHDNRGYARVATDEVDDEDDVELPGVRKVDVADDMLEVDDGAAEESKGSSSGMVREVEEAAEKVSLPDSNAIPAPSLLRRKSSESFLNINEWGEPEGTKQEVLQRLAFCAIGLVVSFCIWGLLQERILTQPYDGQYFEYSYGLVFINRIIGLIMSAALMWYFEVEWVTSPLWEHSFPSVANMLSSWCQYEALKYVSFPTAMLAKAFKLVPVMIMGKLLLNKTYQNYEYISAGLIGVGLYLFINSSEPIDLKENTFGDPENMSGALCGVVLLGLFLCFDSFTGQWQTRMFQLNKAMSPLQMMLIMNAFSAVFSFITLVHMEELYVVFEFLYNHQNMIVHLLFFCVASTVGQLFIFYTVKSFGAVVFSVIMSVRILVSTLLSCMVYSHPVTELGFVGMAIVFGGIAYRTKRKTGDTPLIRWKEQEQAKVVFQEWHEHLDI